jgi:hypothetical protein
MSIDDIMEWPVDLVRKQTYITAEQDQRLKQLAERYHTTEAAILRLSLDRLLAGESAQAGLDPFAGLVGFVDGPAEVDHDDIYR